MPSQSAHGICFCSHVLFSPSLVVIVFYYVTVLCYNLCSIISESERWYHGKLTRPECEEQMMGVFAVFLKLFLLLLLFAV